MKDDEDQELIHIIGKEEAVRAAKEELEKEIKKLVSNYRFIQNHGKCKIFYLYAWETTLRSLMCEPASDFERSCQFFKIHV